MSREFSVILCTFSIDGRHRHIYDDYNMEIYSKENTMKYNKILW